MTFTEQVVLEVLANGKWLERHALHERAGRVAKVTHGKRNSPTYARVEKVLAELVSRGDLALRYVPFYRRPDDPRLGRHYYALTPSARLDSSSVERASTKTFVRVEAGERD